MKTENESNSLDRRVEMEHYLDYLRNQVSHQLHLETQTPQGRSELVRSTGVDDNVLADELVKLGIPADGVIALRLFPLVLVAWAEGGVDPGEREAVMGEAMRIGITEQSSAWLILEDWLKSRPSATCLDAWRRYTHDIFVRMSEVAVQRLIALTAQQMTSIAKASGGRLRVGKVSEKEQSLINQVVATMRTQAKH
jgi:hypothetical protein